MFAFLLPFLFVCVVIVVVAVVLHVFISSFFGLGYGLEITLLKLCCDGIFCINLKRKRRKALKRKKEKDFLSEQNISRILFFLLEPDVDMIVFIYTMAFEHLICVFVCFLFLILSFGFFLLSFFDGSDEMLNRI